MASDELTDINRNHHRRPTNSSKAADHRNHFDQNNGRYRTCCRCHVRGFSLIIGILELIALFAAVVGTAVAYFALPSQQDKATGDQASPGLISHAELSLIGSVIALVLGAVVIAFMVYGLIHERPAFLLPHLIAQLTAIIGLGAAVVVFVYVSVTEADYGPMISFSGKHHRDHSEDTDILEIIYGCIVIGLCALACALEIYFVIVVYRAYIYFCAKKESADKTSGIQLRSTTTSFPGQDSIAAQRFMVQE